MYLLYCFSLLFLISNIMGYDLSIFEIGIISTITYLINRFIFKSGKRFIHVLISLLLSGTILSLYLYKTEKLNELTLFITDFIKEYYLTVTVDTIDIDHAHQLFVIVLLSLLIVPLLKFIIFKRQNHYCIIGTVTLLIVIAGILSDSLNTQKILFSFKIYSSVIIIYSLYIFYENKGNRKGFKHYILIGLISVTIIQLLSHIMTLIEPGIFNLNIFNKNGESYNIREDDSNKVIPGVYVFNNSTSIPVEREVNFDYIELFKTDSLYTRYYKGAVFETYENGYWIKEINIDQPEYEYIHNNNKFDAADYNDYYILEDVHIKYRNIQTPIYFINQYSIINFKSNSDETINYDRARGIYFSNRELDNNLDFSFTSIIPKYGTTHFNNLIKGNDSEINNSSLNIYSKSIDDDRLNSLAREITIGIDNPYKQLLAIESYLKNNYRYNQTPKNINIDKDPAIDFLFYQKEGFCQQFATAFILLARSLNIPTRYVTGFYIEPDLIDSDEPEFSGLDDDFTTVYDSDSHAWPEAFFPESGWIIFDPTPGTDYSIGSDSSQNGIVRDPESEQVLDRVFQNITSTISITFLVKIIILVILLCLIMGLFYLNYIYKTLAPVKQMKLYFRSIKFLYSYLEKSSTVSETLREYAIRVRKFEPSAEEINLMDLVTIMEKVIYGDKAISSSDLDSFKEYVIIAKQNVKSRVSMSKYLKIIFISKIQILRILSH